MAATGADDRCSSSGGSCPPLCAEGGSCTEQRSTEPEDRQSKWRAPWCPEGARGAAGGSHGRLRGRRGAPLLAVSSLRGADGVDDTAVRTLLKLALQKKVEEEEERKLKVEELRQASLASARELYGSKRKRKKRRKKRTPRVSSLFRARRRHRQLAGFAGCVAPRVVFPLVDDWHLLLCNTAGMDQKDSFIVVAMAVVYARLVLLVSLLALCSLLSLSGPDARHHGRYVLEGGLRRAVHKLRIIRSLQFIKVVFIPVVMQRRIPWSHRP